MMADISEGQVQHNLVAQLQAQSSTKSPPRHQQQQLQQSHRNNVNGQQALNLRILMRSNEVGIVIGKKGDNIKRFREVSGAKINVSDSSCPDRIVTITGTLDEVYNAFTMICSKFEDVMLQKDGQSIIGSTSPISSANNGNNNNILLDNSTTSVMDPLFGLTANDIYGSALKKNSPGLKDDLLTANNNNNNSNAINNNNIIKQDFSNTINKVTGIANVVLGGKTTNSSGSSQPGITIKLIVPASQCGSLIGRGGAKIKEIRELTGASIQVAPDVLPNSTERVVTISSSLDSLKSCAYQIFMIMVDSPPKGYTLPYRPKPALDPILLAAATAGQASAAYNLPGQFGLQTQADVNRLLLANNPLAAASFNPSAAAAAAAAAAFNPQSAAATLRAAAASGAAALSAVASQPISSQEMTIPNGLIGCVIGKGGSKINEIRQLSGATIKISNTEEGTKNRTITINGTPDAINLAQYLITARLVTESTLTSSIY